MGLDYEKSLFRLVRSAWHERKPREKKKRPSELLAALPEMQKHHTQPLINHYFSPWQVRLLCAVLTKGTRHYPGAKLIALVVSVFSLPSRIFQILAFIHRR